MQFVVSIFLISLFFIGCKVKNQVEVEYKKLDSLKIVLSSKTNDLINCDTVLLQKAIGKHFEYSVFITNNLNDTIQKQEATHLQKFITGGNNLKSFQLNRINLISRSNLTIQQINKLLNDLNTNALSKDVFLKAYENELKSSQQLTQTISSELKNYNNAIQEFKNVLLPVELLIKSKNNGLLPTAVKDSVSL